MEVRDDVATRCHAHALTRPRVVPPTLVPPTLVPPILVPPTLVPPTRCQPTRSHAHALSNPYYPQLSLVIPNYPLLSLISFYPLLSLIAVVIRDNMG